MEVAGIVVGITKYKEADGIVNLLTKNGLISFKARGILKIDSKLSFLCQNYNVIKVELIESKNNNNHYTLKSGVVEKNVYLIYDNVEAMLTLGYIVELAKKTVDEDNKEKIYMSVLSSIDALLAFKDLASIRLSFLACVIKLVGLGINVSQCVRCQGVRFIARVDLHDGGFVCKNCLQSNEVVHTPLYIKIIKFLFNSEIDEMLEKTYPSEECREIFLRLHQFLKEKLDIQLNSYKLLIKII